MFYSPLRYPGGKNKLAKFIENICIQNNINGHYVEPYAGGASVALYLLMEGRVSEISINDYDKSIYCLWDSVVNNTDELCDLISNTEVNMHNWKKAKHIQLHKKSAKNIELGFSTFFLNRTNISGIINAGVIGGKNQLGKYKIDCRYNKKDLINRIQNIAKFKSKIHLYNLDAINLIKEIEKGSKRRNAIFYFDPPYYLKGKSLYLNHYQPNDHQKVGQAIKKISNSRWIVSYDNVPEIKKIYKGCNNIEYSFFHTAHRAKIGKEILFFSNDLKIPNVKDPVKML